MAKVSLYYHGYYQGEREDVTQSEKRFSDLGINDQISSAIVESGTWQIYEHGNFGGRSVTLSSNGGPEGNGKYPTSRFMGGINSEFSSIELVNKGD